MGVLSLTGGISLLAQTPLPETSITLGPLMLYVEVFVYSIEYPFDINLRSGILDWSL